MKIQSASITMTGESTYSESYKMEASLQSWAESRPPTNSVIANADILELSDSSKAMQNPACGVTQSDEVELEMSDRDKQKLLMIQRMIEIITGKKIRFLVPEKLRLNDPLKDLHHTGISVQQPPKQGWGVIFQAREEYHEHESMSFSAQGNVITADGKKISLQLELNMSRDFAYSNSISFRAGDAVKIDPLTINMDVSSAQLTDQKFSFDLDNDGKSELISFLAPGSGFIALDKNQDGKINNGSELFGAKSGDGFADLAAYDSDRNDWIDENDSIYDKLRIWTKNEKGEDALFALGQKGVGAIYLGNVTTAFSLKDSQNQVAGEIRKTGIFLNENGSVGTIQHIDIAI